MLKPSSVNWCARKRLRTGKSCWNFWPQLFFLCLCNSILLSRFADSAAVLRFATGTLNYLATNSFSVWVWSLSERFVTHLSRMSCSVMLLSLQHQVYFSASVLHEWYFLWDCRGNLYWQHLVYLNSSVLGHQWWCGLFYSESGISCLGWIHNVSLFLNLWGDSFYILPFLRGASYRLELTIVLI